MRDWSYVERPKWQNLLAPALVLVARSLILDLPFDWLSVPELWQAEKWRSFFTDHAYVKKMAASIIAS